MGINEMRTFVISRRLKVDSLYNFVFFDGTVIKRRGDWLMTFNKNGMWCIDTEKLKRIQKVEEA